MKSQAPHNTLNNVKMSSNVDNILASIDAKVTTNFPALTIKELDNIKALLFLSGLYLEDNTIHRLSANSSTILIDPLEQSIAKIIEFYRFLCRHGKNYEFSLSNDSLCDLVGFIDMCPKSLDSNYPDVLKRECELIVPNVINESFPFSQSINSIKIWKSNFKDLQCPFIAIALVLKIMHLFIRLDDNFTNVDWTPLINTIWHSSNEQLNKKCIDAARCMLQNNK